jgi:amino acid transporter
MLVANVINIGVTYAAFYFWLVPGLFPQTNLVLSVLLTIPFGLCFLTTWGLLAILMPRSGGEYIWISRAVHPAVGFGISGLTFVSWAFWTGLAGYWVATLVIGPICSVLGASKGNSTLIDIGTHLQTSGLPSWPWAFGVAVALLSLLLLSRGMNFYYRIQHWMWVVGLLTLAVCVGVLLFGSSVDVRDAFNGLATAGGHHGDAYREVQLAAANKPSGTTLYGIFAMFALFSFVATTSGYIAGEVRMPRRTQLIGAAGGGLVYCVIVLILLLAMAKGVGLGFNNDAAWVSLNDPNHYPVVESPTFMLWMALLAKSNTVVLILVAIGLTIFSVNWAPTVILSASRQLFAWGFDRLLPEPVTKVSRRGSPTLALGIIVALGILLISLYANGDFLYVAPYLALVLAFGFVSVVATLVPFLPTTRRMYEGSPADIRVAGVPLITIVGVPATVFYGIAAYYHLSVSALAFNTTSNVLLTLFSFLVPAVLWFIIKAVRSWQGIKLDAVYRGLPPE